MIHWRFCVLFLSLGMTTFASAEELADGTILSPPQMAGAFNAILPRDIRVRSVHAARVH